MFAKRLNRFARALRQKTWLLLPPTPDITPEKLVDKHFRLFSEPSHVCREGFGVALDHLAGRAASILETGTSAWGTDSTRLWSKYVNTFGGRLWSVDIREDPSRRLGRLGSRVELVVGDSVQFIRSFAMQNKGLTLDLIYFDSFDVDWSDSGPAARHGWAEWQAVQPLVGVGTIVIIDDTPRGPDEMPEVSRAVMSSVRRFIQTEGSPPGKGALIFDFVSRSDEWEILHHSYNLVVRKN